MYLHIKTEQHDICLLYVLCSKSQFLLLIFACVYYNQFSKLIRLCLCVILKTSQFHNAFVSFYFHIFSGYLCSHVIWIMNITFMLRESCKSSLLLSLKFFCKKVFERYAFIDVDDSQF